MSRNRLIIAAVVLEDRSQATADLVVELRRTLAAQGLDAGADTIAWRLDRLRVISSQC